LPALLSLYPKEETYIDSHKADTNFGNCIITWVGAEGLNREYRVLLKFDCSTLPREATVLWAKLRMYVDCAQNPKVTGRVAAQLIKAPWQERYVTWSNCPPFAEEDDGSTACVGGIGWYEWDMEQLLRIWHREPHANNGMLLLDKGGRKGSAKRLIAIKNSQTPNIPFRPYMVVCYDLPHRACDKVILMSRNFIEKTILVKTSAEFLSTKGFNTSQQSQVTFFIKNIDRHPAEIMYEVGPNEADYVPDDVLFEALPGETIAVVPRLFGKFTRLIYRSKKADQNTVLKIMLQSQV
jgi:hypothetical protein